MHQAFRLLPLAAGFMASTTLASSYTVNAGDTYFLNASNDTLAADTIVNNGTIRGDNAYVYVNAGTQLTNNGTILSSSAALRLEGPSIVNDGLIQSTGTAATIDLNYSNLAVQNITGSGHWDIGNGMNVYGKVNLATTGEFHLQPAAIIGGTSDAAGSSFSMSVLSGGDYDPNYGYGQFGGKSGETMTILNGDITKPYNGQMSGGIQLIKNGAGTQVFNSDMTYTGGTQVNGGTLEVNGTSSAAGYGNVDVNAGGALGGTGDVATFAAVHSGGHVAPGAASKSTRGTLSFFGLRLEDGASLDLALASSGASDAVDVYSSGTELSKTTVNISDAGLAVGSTVWFLTFENTLAVDDNNAPAGQNLDASNFTLGTLSPGLQGHFVSEGGTNTGNPVSGRIGFYVDAVPEPASLMGLAAGMRRDASTAVRERVPE